MASTSQTQKGRDRALSALDAVIQVLSLAKDSCGIPPAQAVLGVASALLAMIRDCLANKQDYVDFGLACGNVFKALDRGLKGRRLDELSPSVLEAIEELTTTLAGIQREIVELGKRNAASQVFHSKNDKDKVTAWKQDLYRILLVFNTELAINAYTLLADIHHEIVAGREGAIGQHQSAQASVPLGESPPPRPRTCFGRNELIEEIVGFAENLKPVALIGAGGIGKTSIALAVLHHDRIKARFGDNRRFVRCDKFTASRVSFLTRLSQVVGAGIDHPEDLAPLRPFLSSREMILFLDNAESILDPQGTDSREISAMVEELSSFENICLGITTRIFTVPPHCRRPAVPTLLTEAACDIFYAIYDNGGRSDVISDLVRQLDFHALSITLLATTAFQNGWDYGRLAKEWTSHGVGVLPTDCNQSLAATIELSLDSPTFRQLIPPSKSHKFITSPTSSKLIPSLLLRKLSPSARELLEVIAFFPQGIDEKNLDWLFPTTPNRKHIFDKLYVLSLTHRENGFITMLAPIRDYLCPPDLKPSPLLRTTKDRYLARLSLFVEPNKPGFEETQWIRQEDVNVERLLDVFTSIDASAHDIWKACGHFMGLLHWHKPRKTVLGPKIEGLPDGHRSKAECLFELARLFGSVGNPTEKKRLLTHALSLRRKGWNYYQTFRTLFFLAEVNWELELYKEGIQQVEEVLRLSELFWYTPGKVGCLSQLARFLLADGQLDAAENATLRMIHLLPEKGQEFHLSQAHETLGMIYFFKGENGKAIDHLETDLQIASSFNWQSGLFSVHCSLALLFLAEEEFGKANAHIEQAKSYAADGAHDLGSAMKVQARIWYQQHRHEDARSEVLGALDIYREAGAGKNVEECRDLLQEIERAMES